MGLALFAVALFLAPGAFAAPEPAPSGSASPAKPVVAWAHIRDHQVFSVLVGRGGRGPGERAQQASTAMEHAVEAATEPLVHVEPAGDGSVIYLGEAPVIQVGPDDAAADGDDSVSVHAAEVAAKVTEAVHAERKRSAVATTVFSFSLLVFSALIAFLALGKIGDLTARLRVWVASRPSTIPSVRIGGIDVVRPTALRGVALGAIDASRWVLRIGLAYVWLLFALSLFEVTRPYSERLTGLVLAPLEGFVGRVAGTTPVLLIAAVALVALLLGLRTIALFFDGVTRGEPTLSWLPSDLAAPTSLLIRIGIVVVAASVATPLITGNEEGPLARASVVTMCAIALSLTPIMASAVVGITVLFGRKLKVGDFVELGERAGVVRSVMLLGITLEDRQGCQVRVPHLASLLHPTRVLGAHPPVVVEVSVDPSSDLESVTTLLARAAEGIGIFGRVELRGVSRDAAVYHVTVLSESPTARGDVLLRAVKELRTAGIALGPSRDLRGVR